MACKIIFENRVAKRLIKRHYTANADSVFRYVPEHMRWRPHEDLKKLSNLFNLAEDTIITRI